MSAPETTTPREGDPGDANFDTDHQHTTGSTKFYRVREGR